MSETRRLTRSESDRILVGVCGGLAEHFGIDATIVRLVFVLLTVFGGSGVVIYLVLWLIVPRASKIDVPPRDVVRDGLHEGRDLAESGAEAAKRGYQRLRGSHPEDATGQAPEQSGDVAPPAPGPPPGPDEPDDRGPTG